MLLIKEIENVVPDFNNMIHSSLNLYNFNDLITDLINSNNKIHNNIYDYFFNGLETLSVHNEDFGLNQNNNV